jgi:hypothetical protein
MAFQVRVVGRYRRRDCQVYRRENIPDIAESGTLPSKFSVCRSIPSKIMSTTIVGFDRKSIETDYDM